MRPYSTGLINSIQDLEKKILRLLGKVIEGEERILAITKSRKNRVHAFHQARDYMNSRLGGPLDIETVAAAVGVSPRTLEYAFRDCLDITPIEYIKTRRLAAARKLLLRKGPEEASVSDIALSCGFTHQGYFARDYKSRFLELPSHTLRKMR